MIHKLIKKLHSSKRGEAGLYGIIAFAAFIILAIGVALPIIRSAILCGDIDGCISKLEQNGYWVLAAGSCLNGDLQPCSNDTYDLGDSTSEWHDLFISGDIQGNLIPSQNDTYDVGSPTRYWAHGYFGATSVTIGSIDLSDYGGRLQADSNTLVRSDTVTVATSDASAVEKAQADYVCNGTDDYIELQAAIDDCSDGDSVKVLGETIYLGSTGITMKHDRFTFDASGVEIRTAVEGVAVKVDGDGTHIRDGHYYFGKILGVWPASESTAAIGLEVTDVRESYFDVFVDTLWDGHGVKWTTASAGNLLVETNQWHIFCQDVLYGLYPYGDGSFMSNRIRSYRFDLSDDATFTGGIAMCFDNNTANVLDLVVDDLIIWNQLDPASYGITGNNTKDLVIDYCLCDSCGDNFTLLQDADDTTVINNCHAFDFPATAKLRNTEGVYPLIKNFKNNTTDVIGRDQEILEMFRLGNYRFPAGTLGNDENTGGGYNFWNLYDHWASSGGGAGDIGGARCGSFNCLKDVYELDFSDTDFVWCFSYARRTSDAGATGRLQLDENNAFAALSDHGLGIRADNLDLKLVCYGTNGAEAATDPTITLTENLIYPMEIRFYHGDRVELWVDQRDGNGLRWVCEEDTAGDVPSVAKPVTIHHGITCTNAVEVTSVYVPGIVWMSN